LKRLHPTIQAAQQFATIFIAYMQKVGSDGAFDDGVFSDAFSKVYAGLDNLKETLQSNKTISASYHFKCLADHDTDKAHIITGDDIYSGLLGVYHDSRKSEDCSQYITIYLAACAENSNGQPSSTFKRSVNNLKVLFGTLDLVTMYLSCYYSKNPKSTQPFHDACLIKMPVVADIQVWQSLARKYLATLKNYNEDFYNILANAPKIEKLHATLPGESRESYQKSLTDESDANRKSFLEAVDSEASQSMNKDLQSRLNSNSQATANSQVKWQHITTYLRSLGGYSLKQLRLMHRYCVYSRANENPVAAQCLSQMKVPEDSFNAFLAYTKAVLPVSSDHLLPRVLVDGNKIGVPGYYFCKLDFDDIRGLFLGYPTGCCQSIDSDGHECAKWGWSKENSGFYVMVKGRIPDEIKERFSRGDQSLNTFELIPTRKIVFQTWSWRHYDDVSEKYEAHIILDSHESSKKNSLNNSAMTSFELAFGKAICSASSEEHPISAIYSGPTRDLIIHYMVYVQDSKYESSLSYTSFRDKEGNRYDRYFEAKRPILLYFNEMASAVDLVVAPKSVIKRTPSINDLSPEAIIYYQGFAEAGVPYDLTLMYNYFSENAEVWCDFVTATNKSVLWDSLYTLMKSGVSKEKFQELLDAYLTHMPKSEECYLRIQYFCRLHKDDLEIYGDWMIQKDKINFSKNVREIVTILFKESKELHYKFLMTHYGSLMRNLAIARSFLGNPPDVINASIQMEGIKSVATRDRHMLGMMLDLEANELATTFSTAVSDVSESDREQIIAVACHLPDMFLMKSLIWASNSTVIIKKILDNLPEQVSEFTKILNANYLDLERLEVILRALNSFPEKVHSTCGCYLFDFKELSILFDILMSASLDAIRVVSSHPITALFSKDIEKKVLSNILSSNSKLWDSYYVKEIIECVFSKDYVMKNFDLTTMSLIAVYRKINTLNYKFIEHKNHKAASVRAVLIRVIITVQHDRANVITNLAKTAITKVLNSGSTYKRMLGFFDWSSDYQSEIKTFDDILPKIVDLYDSSDGYSPSSICTCLSLNALESYTSMSLTEDEARFIARNIPLHKAAVKDGKESMIPETSFLDLCKGFKSSNYHLPAAYLAAKAWVRGFLVDEMVEIFNQAPESFCEVFVVYLAEYKQYADYNTPLVERGFQLTGDFIGIFASNIPRQLQRRVSMIRGLKVVYDAMQDEASRNYAIGRSSHYALGMYENIYINKEMVHLFNLVELDQIDEAKVERQVSLLKTMCCDITAAGRRARNKYVNQLKSECFQLSYKKVLNDACSFMKKVSFRLFNTSEVWGMYINEVESLVQLLGEQVERYQEKKYLEKVFLKLSDTIRNLLNVNSKELLTGDLGLRLIAIQHHIQSHAISSLQNLTFARGIEYPSSLASSAEDVVLFQ
jgi:hypothetical protein